MVVEKRKANPSNYTYGNVAYDFDVEINKKERNNIRKEKKNKTVNAVKVRTINTIAILCILSMISLLRFAYIIQINGKISTIKAKISTIQSGNQNTVVEIAQKNNIKDIESIATKKYGMVRAEDDKIVYYDNKQLTK